MSWPSTVTPSHFLPLSDVRPVVLPGLPEVGLGVLGARTGRERLGVHRALDAPRDLLGSDRLAVLPRGVVADRERPLGVVVVGGAEVGGQVGDQHHLAGLGVAGVLRQRPVRQGLLDRVAGDGPAVGRVQRVRTGVAGQEDRDGPARRGTLDVGSGALTVRVLADLGGVGERPVGVRAAGVVARAATCGQRQQRGTGDERQWLPVLHVESLFLCTRGSTPDRGACVDDARRRWRTFPGNGPSACVGRLGRRWGRAGAWLGRPTGSGSADAVSWPNCDAGASKGRSTLRPFPE